MTSSFLHFADTGNVGHKTLFIARLAGLLLLLGSSVVSAQTFRQSDLSEFEVVFEVGNNLITAGTASLRLEKKEDYWRYSLTTKPKGVFKLARKGNIAEVSTFRAVESDEGIALQTQTYQFRQDKERRRAVDATFNWQDKTINHVYRGNEVKEEFTDPVLDRLTVTLLIMNMLRNEFQETQLPIFDTGRIKEVEFIQDGQETIKTRLGELDTVRVINRNASGGSRQTTTWFAPKYHYLPVKIEHRKRGDLVARLSLVRLSNKQSNLELGKALPDDDATDLMEWDKQ